MVELLKTTNAYKVIASDKMRGNLSHAYLVECSDNCAMRGYLKSLAKLIACQNNGEDDCRTCRLIEKETHYDVTIHPAMGEKLTTETAEEIVSASIVRPLEIEKRVFVIDGVEGFAKMQNKLLKTLEEPPNNVVLLMGTCNMSAVLPTVKSRSKKIEIPPFSDQALFQAYENTYTDINKLKMAIALSQGLESKVKQNYESEENDKMFALALDILNSLNSSRDVLSQSVRLNGVDLEAFASVLKLIFGELVKAKSGAISRLIPANECETLIEKFKIGAICEIVEGITDIEKSLYFNANQSMVIDKLLFLILEAKHRWQKL